MSTQVSHHRRRSTRVLQGNDSASEGGSSTHSYNTRVQRRFQQAMKRQSSSSSRPSPSVPTMKSIIKKSQKRKSSMETTAKSNKKAKRVKKTSTTTTTAPNRRRRSTRITNSQHAETEEPKVVTPSPKTAKQKRSKKSKYIKCNANPNNLEDAMDKSSNMCDSPLSASSSNSTTNLHNKNSNSGRSKKNKLPPGVVNIDDYKRFPTHVHESESTLMTCPYGNGVWRPSNHNTDSAYNQAYLSTYGKEFYSFLKQEEDERLFQCEYDDFESCSPSSASSNSSLTSAPLSPSSSSSSSSSSTTSPIPSSNSTTSSSGSNHSTHSGSTTTTSRKRRSPRLVRKQRKEQQTNTSKTNNPISSPISCPLTNPITYSTLTSNTYNVDTHHFSQNLDYMNLETHTHLTCQMRAILIDWLIEISDEYKLKEVTLFTAIGLVDRSLALGKFLKRDAYLERGRNEVVVDRDSLQLLGCACMMIACKMMQGKSMSPQEFAYISGGTYEEEEVVEMELDVCSTLRFHLNIMTPYHFVDRLLRASHVSSDCPMDWYGMYGSNGNSGDSGGMSVTTKADRLRSLVLYLLEIASLYFNYVPLKPSLVASAALYLARATLRIKDASTQSFTDSDDEDDSVSDDDDEDEDDMGYWGKTLQYYTGYDVDDLRELVLHLHKAQFQSENSDQKSVYKKYCRKEHHEVANQTVLLVSDLGFPE